MIRIQAKLAGCTGTVFVSSSRKQLPKRTVLQIAALDPLVTLRYVTELPEPVFSPGSDLAFQTYNGTRYRYELTRKSSVLTA